MAQDKRPRERSRQPGGAADLPQTEDAIGVFRYKSADTLGGPDLHLATQYATIADAFRSSSAPPGDQGDGPLETPS
ncbi:hypothetical protein OG194_46980 [Streptomyces sp. NBC_01288]|uniref:hypothetical protein n=1 Tax=Streptomyces sp. NBC_01288 TaxID=2903814 RepID=UPI002E15D8D3|nr:hypothetical protein OG194_46980 [Streptomyces sp. NBC_01288]